MKILIPYVYTRENNGDAAILSVLISTLKRIFPKAEYKISSMERIEDQPDFEGVPNSTSFLSILTVEQNRVKRLIFTIYALKASFLYVLAYKLFGTRLRWMLTRDLQNVIDSIIDADLLVLVGGGYLKGLKYFLENISFIILVFPLFLATVLNKKIVLHSQSIGPFENNFQRFVIGYLLNRTDLIFAREQITIDLLLSFGVRKEKIVKTVDAGFLFESDTKVTIPDIGKPNGKRVGITVSNKWYPEKKKQEIYESSMAQFADYVIKKGFTVVFIPQVTTNILEDDDRRVSKRVYEKMKDNSNAHYLGEEYNHYEIKSLYKTVDYVVGTRFHSVIFSLASFVPAIAIEYEHKTSGIMRDLELSKRVIKLTELEVPRLCRMFDDLVAERSSYEKLLKQRIPEYKKEAEHMEQLIRALIKKA